MTTDIATTAAAGDTTRATTPRAVTVFENHVVELLVSLVLGPLVAGFVAPGPMAADAVLGVVLATLAWSVGCASTAYLLAAKPFGGLGWRLGGVVVVSVVVTVCGVYYLGRAAVGEDLGSAAAGLAAILRLPEVVVLVPLAAAVEVGLVGAVLGGLGGSWSGYRLGSLSGSVGTVGR